MPEKHLPSTKNRNTRPHLTRKKAIQKHTAWFSTPIFISSGVEMKNLGNHIARFKNIYLRKLTKSKTHGTFTCLLTVCKSVSHSPLLPYGFQLHNFWLPLTTLQACLIIWCNLCDWRAFNVRNMEWKQTFQGIPTKIYAQANIKLMQVQQRTAKNYCKTPRCLLKLSHNITKPTKWLCAQQRLRSAWASTQSDQSLCCVLNE